MLVRIGIGEIIMRASLERRASSRPLDFTRLDFPDVDPGEWGRFITLRLADDEVEVAELPFRYWLQEPFAGDYRTNYEAHADRDEPL